MFTKKLEDQFSADLLNTVRGVLDEAKKKEEECECEDNDDEDDDDEDENENGKKKEMKEGKRGLWDNIHAKRKRIKAGSGERMRKPGSKGAPTNADFRAASEEVEIEEAKNLTGLPKSTAEKNKQYIEITHQLGHKRRVPVHPTNAYKALNRYRNDPSTKSARIVSEDVELDEEKEIPLSHRNKREVSHYRVLNNGKDVTRHDTYEDAKTYAALHRAKLRKDGYKSNQVTVHAYVKEDLESIEEAEVKPMRVKLTKGWGDGGKSMKAGYGKLAGGKDTTDAPFEGPYRKAGERKDQYGNVVKNVAKHLAKKAMMAKEEVEQIDELSATTKDAYAQKAAKQLPDLFKKSSETADGARKYYNRKNTVRKIANEEVEQIDEVGNTPAGKKALGRYIKARRGTILGAGMGMEQQNKDRSTTDKQRNDLGRRLGKAWDGVSRATDRLTKEEVEQIDELSKSTLASYAKKASWQAMNRGTTGGLQLSRGQHIGDSEEEKKGIKKINQAAKRASGVRKAIDRLTKEEQDFIDSLNDADIEQIDELSKDAMLKYLSANKKSGARGGRDTIKRMRGADMAVRKYTARDSKYVRVPATEEVDISESWLTNSVHAELKKMPKDAIKRTHDSYMTTAAGFKKNGHHALAAQAHAAAAEIRQKYLGEDVELEEGRGRPPKEGSAAWHAKQKQDNDDMPALGVQLRKAKSMNKKVRFMDGKEHEIHPNHADRFEDHMAARKTSQEKMAFQKQAHKSHSEFVKAVTASVPKSTKDTGEIVKYRH